LEYTIEWIEVITTSTGKKKADATVKDPQGKTTEVNIWEDFPNFAGLMNGSKISGEVVPPKDPKYKPSLYAPRTPKTGSQSTYKTKLMNDAMEKKEASISHSQDRKEEAIKLASAQRDAVLMVTMINKDRSTSESALKEEIIKWRDWFLSKDFTDVVPF
jgi:hypothetical protein